MEHDRATQEIKEEFHELHSSIDSRAAALLIVAIQFRRLEHLARDFIDMMEKEKGK